MRIPFMALHPADRPDLERAIARVIDRGCFILGPEVEGFEAEFATASGAAHAVSVHSGTDALMLVLRALGIGPGDEVITTPVSAAYTALAILMAGARPVFADIEEDRATLDPAAVAGAITSRTRAIVPVHLYGQPADMGPMLALAGRHGLALIEDCAQAHLATWQGRPVGTLGVAGAFSFYPTKNLGALGDGGAVVTNDAGLAARLRRLRNGGQTLRYHHLEPGVNSRLDEVQAAILRARLPLLAGWTTRRRDLARRYRAGIDGSAIRIPREHDCGHVYHLFTVRTVVREALQRHLAARGVGTLVHYPVPVPRQPAFAHVEPAACPVADRLCEEVLSIPLHPGLTNDEADEVISALREFGLERPRRASGRAGHDQRRGRS